MRSLNLFSLVFFTPSGQLSLHPGRPVQGWTAHFVPSKSVLRKTDLEQIKKYVQAHAFWNSLPRRQWQKNKQGKQEGGPENSLGVGVALDREGAHHW